MVSRSSSKRCSSLYDSLPVLDSWYQPEEAQTKVITSTTTTNTTTTPVMTPSPSPRPSCFSKSSLERPSADGRRSVSFSVEPPSVRYIDESEQHHQEDPVVSEQMSPLMTITSERRNSRGARMKTLAKRLLPKQFTVNKVHAIPSTSS